MAEAFSPNGKVLAITFGPQVGIAESAIHLLDAKTGKDLCPPLEGHRAFVPQLVFWPDGKTLASVGFDYSVRLWDVSDPAHAKAIGRPLRGDHRVRRLALLPDNKTLVTGAGDIGEGSVQAWDTSAALRAEEAYTVLSGVGWDFSATGSSLITLDRDGRIERRDGKDFQSLEQIGKIDPGFVWAAMGGHGRFVQAEYPDHTFRAWDVESNRPLRAFAHSFKSNSDMWVVTPQGRFLIYLDDENRAVEWDPVEGKKLNSWPTPDGINTYAATFDGRRQILPAWGGTSFFRDTDRSGGRAIPVTLDSQGINGASFSPDGSLLATANLRGPVELWRTTDLAAGGKVSPVAALPKFALGALSCAFSIEGRLAVASGGTEAVRLYDVESRQDVLTLPASGAIFQPTGWSADGSVLGSANSRGELYLWRAPSWEEIDAADGTHTARP
jgi:WD40 repeat protein